MRYLTTVAYPDASLSSGTVQRSKLEDTKTDHIQRVQQIHKVILVRHHASVSAAFPVISLTWPLSAKFKMPVR